MLLSAGRAAIDPYLLPAGPTAANPQQPRLGRQTDGRTLCRYIDPASHPILAVPMRCCRTGKGSPCSITERRVPELMPVLGSQPAGDVSHKPGGRLLLLSAIPAVTLAALSDGCYQFRCLVNRGTMSVNSLPNTVTRQRRGCDLNPGPTAPESSTLTTLLPSDPVYLYYLYV